MSYIDLSHQINTETPVYPGDPKVKIEAAGVLSKDGFADRLLTFGTHVGTHIDAPAHMIEGGKTLDQYPLDRLMGKALVWDISEDISGDIPTLKGVEAVFFYTGASKRYHEESYWSDYPVIPTEVLEFLISKGITLVGIDTGSFDIEEDFPIHKLLLSNDILLLENLTNLEDLVGKTVDFTALPLNVTLDGAPCRVIAKL